MSAFCPNCWRGIVAAHTVFRRPAGGTRDSDAVFIAVGTPPTESGDADLSYAESSRARVAGGSMDISGGRKRVQFRYIPASGPHSISHAHGAGSSARSMSLRIREFCAKAVRH